MAHVHFIGVGGYSMSGLALWMHQKGHRVTGSDMNPSSRTERLERAGIPVYYGHAASHVAGAERVVYNTDVRPDNPERAWAEAQGIPLVHRSEVLAEILDQYRTITVSGTHGKTTTTTMIGHLLADAGLDPTVFVGGEVGEFDGNLRVGHSVWAVAEADESDGTFLRYHPDIAVATNIEPEHLDHFENRFDRLVEAFRTYLSRVPDHGLAVIGVDNPILARLAADLSRPAVTYGLGDTADLRAIRVEPRVGETRAEVVWGGRSVGQLRLVVPGVHNVVNSLAALAVGHHLGIPWDTGLASLEHFHNAARRFQILAETPFLVVDDYAHHPTEIRATLKAARQVTRGRVVALFQPQRYVRTQNLWDAFVEAFQDADILILTEIYAPPGESPIAGITGEKLADAIRSRQHPVYFVSDMWEAVPMVKSLLTPGDTFITMGAGPVYQVAQRVALDPH
mgnify:CR=1 FL=1